MRHSLEITLNFYSFFNLRKKLFFWCAPFGYMHFLSFHLLNEPGLGVGIYPGMALTPLPSSIGWDRTHDLPIVSQVLYR
jgi:hypothetical protein